MSIIQPHCGYYWYRGQAYFSRETLLDAMMINRDFNPPLDFYKYNEDIFDSLDWTYEPPISLTTLYKHRARQLREKYDYIILGFSGGADSTEVLETFLQEGLFVDEIQTVHYQKIIDRLDKDKIVNDESLSILHEYQAAVLPRLKRVKELSPNTKITELDASDYAYEQIAKRKFEYMGINHNPTNGMSLAKPLRIYNTYIHSHNNQTIKKDKVAFIRGGEKPLLFLYYDYGRKPLELIFRFSDIPMHGVRLIREGAIGELYTIEDFFWSPDAPLIPIKQSHVLKNAIETNKELFDALSQNNSSILDYTQQSTHLLERLYSPFLYGSTKTINFIAPKPKHNPEVSLISLIDNDMLDYSRDLVKDKLNYYKTKYKEMKSHDIINRNWLSKPYHIGKLNLRLLRKS
jgi:hypothetical protein